MKVAHFIPAYRSVVHVEIALALARDAAWCEAAGYQHWPFFIDAAGIARARNRAVQAATERGADLLLMQDSDVFMVLSHASAKRSRFGSALDALWDTMRRNDAAAVGAAVPVRNGQSMNCEPARPGEVYPGKVGTGLMLIDLRKLADLPRPWFVHTDRADGLDVECSEDIYFCRQLEAAGLSVFVDYGIDTGHAYTVASATRI